MIHRITILLIVLFLAGCNSQRDQVVSEKSEAARSEIKIGDDIFEAKNKLVTKGFGIKYGPDFPTKTERYLMMIVDYGVDPSGLEVFKYTVGIESNADPISGIIKATPEGKITSIE
ncbi:hypothetical protein DDZ13_10075 [Coraliomargarita sinensis]|uniref:Uncharacterized protein n=1 Tax=Coraliomargarita sinensis TaxID=2174842 RepID=A0A317ZEU3_9BACT|nr:hypothetical protein [Coraliomargarita sinensis]PXA03975.1 hypothetical protein DDZ13_10075 [Coraliomargarita sinensis]